jgi:hypothetical protein
VTGSASPAATGGRTPLPPSMALDAGFEQRRLPTNNLPLFIKLAT